ncbi:hypothetical protein JQC92_21700 [Shewanella sp. 202IG2-18]|uniref:hypothetical protein n=1 Tax=Parashewanella hymeniacidonis TaxID=2807618 RepID=UPI001960E931|nr:hypothetical protein [Parashewanella hymeniacidonis]MBM7074597.1 hypothetical protein [Parashewanella hymeniacidonis]
MESVIKVINDFTVLQFIVSSVLLIIGFWCLYRVVKWAKGMPKVAFLILAIFPLISIFPIPPPAFNNVEKAKVEQRKTKQNNGDSDDD